MTMIVIHLDTLDVVANALAAPIPATVKEEINLFASAIVPVLLAHVNEEPLPITLGLLGLILDRSDVRAVACTKAGLLLLTMLISRAELLKEASAAPGAARPFRRPRTSSRGSSTRRCTGRCSRRIGAGAAAAVPGGKPAGGRRRARVAVPGGHGGGGERGAAAAARARGQRPRHGERVGGTDAAGRLEQEKEAGRGEFVWHAMHWAWMSSCFA